MGIKFKRKILKIGDSRGITLPGILTMGQVATFAANRIIIMDPRGEISEESLLRFLEEYIEPEFWSLSQRNLKDSPSNKIVDDKK